MKLIWILINCNSKKEAYKIGKQVLQRRLAGCFDVLSRSASSYFWPPKSGKIERAKGCVLILTTPQKHAKEIHKLVKKFHSDKVPFIASIELRDVNLDYVNWIKEEIS